MQGTVRVAGAAQDNVQKSKKRAVLRRLLPYLSPFRVQLLGVFALVVVSAGVQAIGPALIGRAIDFYIGRKDLTGLGQIMLQLLGIYVIGLMAQASLSYLIGLTGQRFLTNLSMQIFDKVQTLSLDYFDKHETGDLMSRLVNDVQVIDQLFSRGLIQVISSLFSLIGILIAMLALSLPLALMSFVMLPVMIGVTVIFARSSRRAFRLTRTELGAVSSELEEELVGVRVVQAFNRTDATIQHFAKLNAANRDANVHAVVVTSAFTPAIDLLSVVAMAIVAGCGGWLAVNHQIAVGTVVAFFIYVQQFFRTIYVASDLSTQLQGALAGVERIFDLMDTPVEQKEKPGAQPLPPVAGRVAFEHVNFAYTSASDATEMILHDINLVAEAGQTIAIVGETGAGKSTLVNLIPRFYDVSGGQVTIDGHDVRDVTLASLRSQVGMVQQETFLFAGTIGDNIRYGRLDASDTEVEQAAKIANIHDSIVALPQGYKTILGEQGSGLSQGQRQLISFARTILAGSRILILDEATSSIDTHTEALIEEALKRLLKDRTAFVIAHRLSTVHDANVVLVLDHGQIVERGTHAELLANNGKYAELYRRQFS